jgi:hypothetical protein
MTDEEVWMAIERLADAQERQTELLERRNELLEDRNALLWAMIEAYYYVSHEPPERLYESAERSGTPSPRVEDGLFTLNYTGMLGQRTNGRPEEADDR